MNGSSHYMLWFQDTLSTSKHWFVDVLPLGMQMYQIKQGKKGNLPQNYAEKSMLLTSKAFYKNAAVVGISDL